MAHKSNKKYIREVGRSFSECEGRTEKHVKAVSLTNLSEVRLQRTTDSIFIK